MTKTTDEIKSLLLNIITIWTKGDKDAIDKYYAKDFHGEYYGKKVCFEDLIRRIDYLQLNLTDRKIELQQVIHQGNHVAIRFHWEANDISEGHTSLDIAGFYEFNDQWQVTKAWAYANEPVDYTLMD